MKNASLATVSNANTRLSHSITYLSRLSKCFGVILCVTQFRKIFSKITKGQTNVFELLLLMLPLFVTTQLNHLKLIKRMFYKMLIQYFSYEFIVFEFVSTFFCCTIWMISQEYSRLENKVFLQNSQMKFYFVVNIFNELHFLLIY